MCYSLERWLPGTSLATPAAAPSADDSSHPEAAPLIDPGILHQFFGEIGDEMAPQVLFSFITQLQEQTAAMETANDRSDPDALSKAAHRLKGSAASFGATRLGTALVEPEQAARHGHKDSVSQALPAVITLAGSTLHELLALQAVYTDATS